MKVVGVMSQNEEGSARQDIIKQTKTDEPLRIEWDGSPDCPELLCVYDAKNRQLGNIKKELSKEIVYLYENHYVGAKVVEVTGNEETHYSCEIELTITPEPVGRVPLTQKIALSDRGMFRQEEEAQREAKKKKQLRDGTAIAVGSLIGALLLNAFCAAIFSSIPLIVAVVGFVFCAGARPRQATTAWVVQTCIAGAISLILLAYVIFLIFAVVVAAQAAQDMLRGISDIFNSVY